MTKSFQRRVKKLQRSKDVPASAPPGEPASAGVDFAADLREARLRAFAGNPIPRSVITPEMMEDPVNGEFCRQMHEARERERRLRK